MKPFKSGALFASWLLRLSLVFLIFLLNRESIQSPNFSSVHFYFAAVFCLLAILLLFGGILGKPGLTVISGLLIALSAISIIVVFKQYYLGIAMANNLLIVSIGFYFFSNGNK